MPIQRILVVDSNTHTGRNLAQALEGHGCQAALVTGSKPALDEIRTNMLDLVLVALSEDEPDPMEALTTIRERCPDLPLVAVVTEDAAELTSEAVRAGAADVLIRPWSSERLSISIERVERIVRLEQENRYLRQELIGHGAPEFVARSPAMIQTLRTAGRLSRSKGAVLISGEEGTGKELIARHIQHNSARENGPFIRLSCSQFPGQTLEAELFGRESNAFAGTARMRTGRLELAAGGTLLLQEISETSLDAQSRILGFIDKGEFQRVGGTRHVRADVRVIATTHRDLDQLVSAGRFDEDLCARLKALWVQVPPLRERREDLPGLAEYFVERAASQAGIEAPRLTPEALEALAAWSWPGNLREFESVIERVVVVLRKPVVGAEDLGLLVPSAAGSDGHRPDALHVNVPTVDLGPSLANRPMEEIERVAILATLAATGGNKTEAARRLGLTARTLSNKMKLWRAAGLVA